MRKIKTTVTTLLLMISLTMLQTIPVFAVTEDEITANGTENTAGSIFIWFLCAIAFLKSARKSTAL